MQDWGCKFARLLRPAVLEQALHQHRFRFFDVGKAVWNIQTAHKPGGEEVFRYAAETTGFVRQVEHHKNASGVPRAKVLQSLV